MFKKEYIITKHAAKAAGYHNDTTLILIPEDHDYKLVGRTNTVTEAIMVLISALMSEGILKGIVESPYDELSKYQIDEIAYRIDDDIYMITEIIDDDCSSISHIFESLCI